MKKLTALTLVLITVNYILFVQSCRKPDQAGPNRQYCESGRNILTLSGISQGAVPDSTKQMIYGTGAAGSLGNWYNDLAKNITRKLVILPVTYTGVTANTYVTTSFIRNALFSTGTGSVRDFFYENSWGTYALTEGAINPSWITLPQSTTQYGVGQVGNDFTRNPQVPSDACTLSSIDWTTIDVNGDRIITRDEAVVCLLNPLGGAGATRYPTVTFAVANVIYTIPSANPVCYFDCRTNATQTGTDDISYNYSTIWHELSHAQFDLPDRYQQGICGVGWTGSYDLMSDNCRRVNMNIVDKIKLGWITPPILANGNSTTCYNFPASENNPAALILWNSRVPRQYFVIENRLRSASPRNFDGGLPSDGLLVWWVDENNPNLNQRVSLVDGRLASSLLTNDPTVLSTPYYNGGEYNVPFKNISCASDTQCPIVFLQYGAGAPSSTILLHGLRAVSGPQQNMYAAVF